MVDTCSIHLSSQKLVQTYAAEKNISLEGFYWFIVDSKYVPADKFKLSTFQKAHRWEFADWDLMEFLITAPEPPLEDVVDRHPVFKQYSKEEKIRSEIYPMVSDGAVDFAKRILSIFDGIEVDIQAEDVTKWINCFITTPDEYEKAYIQKIKHGYDSNHEMYIPICKPWFNKNLSSASHNFIRSMKLKAFGVTLVTKEKSGNSFKIKLFGKATVLKVIRNLSDVRVKLFNIPVAKISLSHDCFKFYLFNKIQLLKITK